VNLAGRNLLGQGVISPPVANDSLHEFLGESCQDPDRCRRRKAVTITPRVVLADDQKEVLQSVAITLGHAFTVVGTAENGEGAVELATQLSPDVLVLDISMPVQNGIEAARHLKELGSTARVVFLTVNTEPEFVEAALFAGALGYVLKQSLASDLVPAIWAAINGATFISPSMELS
jgi:DNA-binding NarL/FixJ family response regulator